MFKLQIDFVKNNELPAQNIKIKITNALAFGAAGPTAKKQTMSVVQHEEVPQEIRKRC
jgi:hypothetical protein